MKHDHDLPRKLPDDEKLVEYPAWEKIKGAWRPLYGDFYQRGVSLEWHDFHVAEEMDWSQSFHEGSLEVCLNYSGEAVFNHGRSKVELRADQVATYNTRRRFPEARRLPRSIHRFVTLELSVDFLRAQFSKVMDGLREDIRKFVENPGTAADLLSIQSLPTALLAMRLHLLEPPVHASAVDLWYQGKVLELLAQTLFRENKPAELFCDRHKRVHRERAERARFLLERDLENPPSLEMLAGEVDCSPFYLSRIFAQEMGMSIPKYIRTKRIEQAGELLKAGKSVTDAAMTVGYSSLSAFNKAFVQQMGCCPGLYPVVKRKP